MKTKDKLTAFVQACVDGGWTDKYDELRVVSAFKSRRTYRIEFHPIENGHNAYPFSLSLPDLIMDADAMRSAYGEGCVRKESGRDCPWEALRKPNKEYCEYKDGRCRTMIKIGTYRAMQATRIAHEDGTEAAINYLYDNLGGEEK